MILGFALAPYFDEESVGELVPDWKDADFVCEGHQLENVVGHPNKFIRTGQKGLAVIIHTGFNTQWWCWRYTTYAGMSRSWMWSAYSQAYTWSPGVQQANKISRVWLLYEPWGCSCWFKGVRARGWEASGLWKIYGGQLPPGVCKYLISAEGLDFKQIIAALEGANYSLANPTDCAASCM